MRGTRRTLTLSLVIAAGTLSVVLFSQARIDPRLLAFKKVMADQQSAAIATPLTGVRTAAGVRAGLFPIRATGVSTESIRRAADVFLASLTPAQMLRTQFVVDDSEWRRWSNVDNAAPKPRASTG